MKTISKKSEKSPFNFIVNFFLNILIFPITGNILLKILT